jgi:hypothetical protein
MLRKNFFKGTVPVHLFYDSFDYFVFFFENLTVCKSSRGCMEPLETVVIVKGTVCFERFKGSKSAAVHYFDSYFGFLCGKMDSLKETGCRKTF